MLEAVGKVFTTLLLDRLMMSICPSIIPDVSVELDQVVVHWIFFSVRQLNEKSIEPRMALYEEFVNITKAVGTVNMIVLWTILGKM